MISLRCDIPFTRNFFKKVIQSNKATLYSFTNFHIQISACFHGLAITVNVFVLLQLTYSSSHCLGHTLLLESHFSYRNFFCHWTATEREGKLRIIDYIGMQYVKKDDTIRMSHMYDCTCKVRTSRSIRVSPVFIYKLLLITLLCHLISLIVWEKKPVIYG